MEKTGNSSDRKWFSELSSSNGVSFSPDQLDQFEMYVRLLADWNSKINLVSRKDEENIWRYHILHSISPLFKIRIDQKSAIVDIGTGGGLPGIPLKIARPDLSILCIDSTAKKINADVQMVKELRLSGIELLWGRAEEIGLNARYFRKFDFAVARSVAQLDDLVKWAENFLKEGINLDQPVKNRHIGPIDSIGPALLAYKGGDVSEESEKAKKKNVKMEIFPVDLTIPGAEQYITTDKKLLIVRFLKMKSRILERGKPN